jgi:putative hydrolase of the HAD superfamily
MIKVILFDCDGVIVKQVKKYFRQRMKEEFGMVINEELETFFFRNNFLLCETGKLDLKTELSQELPKWGIDWPLEKVLDYWFSGEAEKDPEMIKEIARLRSLGIKCYLSTNNEKYRVEYLTNVVGLGKILDGIFSSASLGYLKPNLNFWTEIYKKFSGIEKDEILVLDNKREMANSAKEFGFHSHFYTSFENYKTTLHNQYYL